MFTLPETAQEVFDIVYKYLMKQKCRCTHDGDIGSGCAYRGLGGTKCAAGVLIPDEKYERTFEHKRWDQLVEKGWVPNSHKHLIMRLQTIHDLTKPELWNWELRRAAEEFQLLCPELSEEQNA